VPSNTLVPICFGCKHFRGLQTRIGWTCKAFEEGIPTSILASHHDHRAPYPGDHSVLYEPKVNSGKIDNTAKDWPIGGERDDWITGMPAWDEYSKEDVEYQPVASDRNRVCELCRYFIPIKSCELVTGYISPEGHCNLWESMEGKDMHLTADEHRALFARRAGHPANDYIAKSGKNYVVYSENGKRMGSYPSREEAEKRLRQIEYFKNKGHIAKDMTKSGWKKIFEGLAELVRFFSEEEKEPEHSEDLSLDKVWIEMDHPRDDKGRFAFKGSGGSNRPHIRYSKIIYLPDDREEWPGSAKKLRIPSVWDNIKFNLNSDALVKATGLDKIGRRHHIYNEDLLKTKAAARYHKLLSLWNYLNKDKNQKNKDKEDDDRRDDRDDVTQDFSLRKSLGRHTSLPNSVKRSFLGVDNKFSFEHTKDLEEKGFSARDLRAFHATKAAYDLVAKMEKPDTEEKRKEAILEVANKVGPIVGLKPEVALQSYINPVVFTPWDPINIKNDNDEEGSEEIDTDHPPIVWFGFVDNPLPDWRVELADEEEPADGELLPRTPADVVMMLDFDPLDLFKDKLNIYKLKEKEEEMEGKEEEGKDMWAWEPDQSETYKNFDNILSSGSRFDDEDIGRDIAAAEGGAFHAAREKGTKNPIDPNKRAASVAFVTNDGCILFVRRSQDQERFPGYWALPGGMVEEGEDYLDAAKRECLEEIGDCTFDGIKPLSKKINKGWSHVTFVVPAKDKFQPKLNSEHDGYVWAPVTDAPKPLHPGLRATIAEVLEKNQSEAAGWEGYDANTKREYASDYALDKMSDYVFDWVETVRLETRSPKFITLAFDRKSVREKIDGRLHVKESNISKANIGEYWGREIPGFRELGLDPEKKYSLLRDPEELRKAAHTFNGLPILDTHVPVSTTEFPQEHVVGSTGNDAVFDGIYLKNSLTFWRQDAIDNIESGRMKELSAGYKYTPVMEPGVFKGVPYDGRMTNIEGNHIALVVQGRAGTDVCVGDSYPEDGLTWENLENMILSLWKEE